MSGEEWRPVPGYPHHEASSEGRIRSFARKQEGHILSLRQPRRYVYVRVSNRKKVKVHHLVAAAFLGPRPDGHEIRHLNDDKTDNRAVNLAYGTSSENARDAVRNGTNVNASKTHCKRGHEFTPENTYPVQSANGRPGRSCRACLRIHAAKYRARLKAQAAA